MVRLSTVQTMLIFRIVSLATTGPLAPSRLVSLYVLVELLAVPEVVLLIRVQGSKQPSGLWGFVRWAAGAALQREGLTARRGHGKDSAWLESLTWSELANQLRDHD